MNVYVWMYPPCPKTFYTSSWRLGECVAFLECSIIGVLMFLSPVLSDAFDLPVGPRFDA